MSVHALVDDVVRTHTAKVVAIPSDETFSGEEYIPAPELREIADMLRERHNMPTEITIECVWKRKGGNHQGKTRLAFCMKTSGLAKFYSSYDFVIWVAADHLREWNPTPEQIEALIFHELHHAGVEEESLDPIVVGHDFEGFRADLENYGLWTPDLTNAAPAFEQVRMFVR